MAVGLTPLGGPALAKAERQMRALRRAILAYWYATIEDQQAALIEAANACVVVNILDESVFEAALGDVYRERRADSAGGRVISGLELVRNCETHSPVSFDDLVVQRRAYSIPLHAGGQVMRSVWHWAVYDSLPTDYVELPADAGENQKRARKEAQHGYRQGVQRRSVIETLFDAERFFCDVEPRLRATNYPALEHSFAEVPQGEATVLHRPLEGFVGAVPLPHIATRWDERSTSAVPPADRYVEALATGKKRDSPTGEKRIITHKVSEAGRLVGFSGHTVFDIVEMNWVERSAQIGRDIRGGFTYVAEQASGDVIVTATENLALSAVADGRDVLADMNEAPEERGLGRLHVVEQYPDLYVSMRNGL